MIALAVLGGVLTVAVIAGGIVIIADDWQLRKLRRHHEHNVSYLHKMSDHAQAMADSILQLEKDVQVLRRQLADHQEDA